MAQDLRRPALDRAAESSAYVDDALLRGQLPLRQPTRGYRTNVDALWLAAFACRARSARSAIDLGAGVGAVGLALLVMGGAERATLVELDPVSAALARSNAEGAGLGGRVDIVLGDVGDLLLDRRQNGAERDVRDGLRHAHDLVVANPPYGVRGAARVSPDPSRALARTGDAGTLLTFARGARAALGAKGRACFVYPAGDLARLLDTLRNVGLEPKRLRLVHPVERSPARVALVEAKPARPGGLRVEAPLVVMTAPGRWGEEAARILAGPTEAGTTTGASRARPPSPS